MYFFFQITGNRSIFQKCSYRKVYIIQVKMNKVALCFLLFTIVVLGNSSISQCQPNYKWTAQLGCIQLCSSPSFKDCGDFFPLIYNPSFCGLDNSGRWQSFTFACQACKQGFLAVTNGKCSCNLQPCQSGQKCVNGACIQQPKCGAYEIDSPAGCILSCKAPQFAQCPDIINTLIYDPKYCGYRRTGEWISYTHVCQACNSADGIGVKNDKCTCKDLGCRSDQVCNEGYCQNVVVPGCSNNFQCPSGYFCNGNTCVDRCIVTLCQIGHKCVKGQCIKVSQCPCRQGYKCVGDKCIQQFSCTSNSNCQFFQICNAGKCINKCALTLCSEGTTCQNGECIPIQKQCSSSQQCKSYQFCLGGKCTDKCAYIKCSSGYICKFGGCIPNNQCSNDNNCSANFTCQAGSCVDLCAGIICGFAQTCQSGKCVFINDCRKACPTDQICRFGECVDPCIFTTCLVGSHCRAGKCIDTCSIAKCGTGYICQQGKCIKNPKYCLEDGQCKSGEFCSAGICLNKCSKVACRYGQVCVNGICQENLNYCPASSYPKVQFCTDPRPNFKTCPDVQYVRAPDPAYCGVLADGSRVNFPRQCETCRDSRIVYYFDVPCHDAPFVCNKGECLGYYCGNQACSINSDCPYDWQTCFSGKCVDRCALLRCASCKFGQCAYQEPYGRCNKDSDCLNDSWNCVGFKCVDQCVRTKCPPNQECFRGECRRT